MTDDRKTGNVLSPRLLSPAALTSSFLVAGTLSFLQVRLTSPPLLLLERYLPGGGWLEMVAAALYAGWLTDNLLNAKRPGHLRRRIWLMFSLVFYSQFVLGVLGLERMLMTGDLHVPVPVVIVAGPLYRGEGFFMVGLFLVTVALVGPAWCSHLCYFGAWDNLAAVKVRRPGVAPKWLWMMRVAIAITVQLGALGLARAGVAPSLAALTGILFGVIGVGLMIFWSRQRGLMLHCLSWCPIGLLAAVLGKISPFRLRINNDCTDCGACSFACRYDALRSEHISRRKPGFNCTLCGDCVRTCPHRSISFRFLRLSPEAARILFIVLVVSLHTIFLVLARV